MAFSKIFNDMVIETIKSLNFKGANVLNTNTIIYIVSKFGGHLCIYYFS